MPGFEVIGKEEKNSINKIFSRGNGIMFRHGFEKLRNNQFLVDEFEYKFKKKFNSKYSLAVTSGTAALRVAIASLNLNQGDEIITQSFTFVATVEAIIESKCKPVCTEIDESYNMCSDDLIKKISNKTKVVIVVHMLGQPANLQKIKKICKKFKLILIEDTAWGIGGKFGKKFLGTVGDIGTFSFDFAKTITTGEGGMIVFKNKKHYISAKAWHDHGHENNPKLNRWEDTRKMSGFNFRMSELNAAIGLAQLKKFNEIFKRHEINKKKILNKIKSNKNFMLPKIPKLSKPAAEAILLNLGSKNKAIEFRKKLLKYNIGTKILPEATTWHFAGDWEHIKIKNKKFPKTEKILKSSVAIPILFKMKNNFPDIIKDIIISLK